MTPPTLPLFTLHKSFFYAFTCAFFLSLHRSIGQFSFRRAALLPLPKRLSISPPLRRFLSLPIFQPTDIRCYARSLTDPPSHPASLRRSHRRRRRSSLLPQPERHARRSLQLDSLALPPAAARISRPRVQRHRSQREAHPAVCSGFLRADRQRADRPAEAGGSVAAHLGRVRCWR